MTDTTPTAEMKRRPGMLFGQRPSASATFIGLAHQTRRQLMRMTLALTAAFVAALIPGIVEMASTTNLDPNVVRQNIAGWIVMGTVALVSISKFVALRRNWIPDESVNLSALVFCVFGALAIALAENWGRFAPHSKTWLGSIGISWVCVWLTAYSILIPAPNRRGIPTLLLAASMGPLALALNLWINGYRLPADEQWRWLSLFWPNFVAAGIGVVNSHYVRMLRGEIKEMYDLGSYRLVEKIGEGGMGEVWRAQHRLLARSVAVKLILPEALEGRGVAVDVALKRFEREARATAQLRSPHTIEVFDFGATETGEFYYVMEYLRGLTVDQLIERYGPMPPERVVALLTQVCLSLGDAHSHELIHRDIKPANLFVCNAGEEYDFVKVLDFGLVKRTDVEALALDDSESGDSLAESLEKLHLTRAGSIAGTPAFMAPEQIRMLRLDQRADLYSLGCVAYYMLTGKLVFRATSPVQMWMMHIGHLPEPPSRHTTNRIPRELDAVVMRCLEKEPALRFKTATSLRLTLQAIPFESSWTNEHARDWWRRLRTPAESRPGASESSPTATMEAPSGDLGIKRNIP